MTAKKRNALYWIFKVTSVIVACAFPLMAIRERFPLFREAHWAVRSIGAGGVLAALVLIVIFKKTIFGGIRERLKMKRTPPLLIWVVMLILAYAILSVCSFLLDIIMVLWMGLIGCGIGTILSMVAEFCFGKEKENEGT